jgi:AcrR family transcriptional regulator
MSPRTAAVLRGGDQDLREHLIAAAATLISRQGTAGLSVRDIAREAKVADGVLYNYFSGKEDLIAHGLRAHVRATLQTGAPPPVPGTATVEANLVELLRQSVQVLNRVLPAFAGIVGQPKVLSRFQELISGDMVDLGTGAKGAGGSGPAREPADGPGDAGLPTRFTDYLTAERRLGRIAADADAEAAATLLIGAAHDLVLPHVLYSPDRDALRPLEIPPGHIERIVALLLRGIGTERAA